MSAETVNKHLRDMRAAGKMSDIKAKGAAGELAALDVVHDYYLKRGGILKQGFMYPYASNRQNQIYLGNIFWDEEHQCYTDMTKQLDDEIDILYISNYRVFPIEVKAYHDMDIRITDEWMWRGGKRVDKSPLAQAEKHARHLYHQIYDVLPEGDPSYIHPIVCFVDACDGEDERSDKMKKYLTVTTLTDLTATLCAQDIARPNTLDLDMIEKKLKEIEKERTL